MKKILIAIAIVALLGISAQAADTVGKVTYRVVAPVMVSSTNTAVATYTAPANRVTLPLAVYQVIGGTTQTNTVTLTKTITGVSGSFAAGSLTAVATGNGVQTVGAGDVTADVDDIVLVAGDALVLTGAGTASANVTYRILVKEIAQ